MFDQIKYDILLELKCFFFNFVKLKINSILIKRQLLVVFRQFIIVLKMA